MIRNLSDCASLDRVVNYGLVNGVALLFLINVWIVDFH